MERIATGLSLEELEGQRVELLPDRVEMRRRKGIRILNNNQNANSNTLFNVNNIVAGNETEIEVVVAPVVIDGAA